MKAKVNIVSSFSFEANFLAVGKQVVVVFNKDYFKSQLIEDITGSMTVDNGAMIYWGDDMEIALPLNYLLQKQPLKGDYGYLFSIVEVYSFPNILSVEKYAEYMCVSRQSVYGKIKRNTLPSNVSYDEKTKKMIIT